MSTMNEKLLDAAIRHQVQLLRYSKGEATRAASLLKQSDAEIVAKLKAGLETATSEARLKSMLVEIRRMREAVAEQIKGQIKGDALELAQNEVDWEMAALQGASPVALSLSGPAASVVKTLAGSPINGVPLDGWLGQLVQGDINRIEQAVRLGTLQGETARQITDRVLAATDMTRQNAEAVVLTSANHISNSAKQSVWEVNEDILAGVRWSATLDGRTSPVCRSRDGVVYPVREGPRPPAHPRCRSAMVPVTKGEKIIGERPMVRDTRTRKEREVDFRAEAKAAAGDKWKGMTPAQRDAAAKARRLDWIDKNVGTVPSNVTYNEWLKRQPKAFQDDVLGSARGELFRKGMTLDKFVDADGRQYSLAELKAQTTGDKLYVLQPGVGLKAKAMLQQGMTSDQVLKAIKAEFPDANTSIGSLASYKVELKKAGLLEGVSSSGFTVPFADTVAKVESVVKVLENTLPPGVKQNIGNQWATMSQSLLGSPGAYAYYQGGKGVTFSLEKMAGISMTQAQQVMAHELSHMLHKQHQVDLPAEAIVALKASIKDLDADGKKLYSYYLMNMDELTAEIYAQALSPSPITSQGLLATQFNKVFAGSIDAAKIAFAKKFPAPSKGVPPLTPGAPAVPFEVAGKHTSIGSLAKALLQQGMPDEQVLLAIKAEFPQAKTGLASIASYKSELNKLKKIGGHSGPTVIAKGHVPSQLSPPPPPPAVAAAVKQASDPISDLLNQPQALSVVSASKIKETGLKLMEMGVLQNGEIASVLAKLYPKNKLSMGSISTWKSLWKKANPQAYAKASAKHVKLDLSAEGTGPTKVPFLNGKPLGPKSSGILEEAKKQLAAGASTDAVKKFIDNSFSAGSALGANAQGIENLLELAIYQVQTAKALGKPYLGGAATYKPFNVPESLNIGSGKVLPKNFTVATAGELDELLGEILFEDASDKLLDFIELAKLKGLVIKPMTLKQWLADAEMGELEVGDDMLDMATKTWDALPTASSSSVQAAATLAKKTVGTVDMTPSRLAVTPYDGKPPPPRFTGKQHLAALKSMSSESGAPAYAEMVNDRFKLTGDNAVTSEEIGVIRSYTGNQTYAQVNEHLRNGRYASNIAVQAYVDAAQSGLSKMPPYVGPVTRGVRWLPNGMSIDQFLARYQVGTVVEENSFLSTSKGNQAVYQGPAYFKINSLTGRDVDWISKYSGGEKEVLMMPGTRLSITKVEKDVYGKWIIYADEVL